MPTINANKARAILHELIDDVAESHVPTTITGPRNNAVLVAESDWNAIQETLHLHAIPGMGDSIKEGMASRVEDCAMELDW